MTKGWASQATWGFCEVWDMSVRRHCSSGRCSEERKSNWQRCLGTSVGRGHSGPPHFFAGGRKIKALPEGPAGQPDTSPGAWGLSAASGWASLPCNCQLAPSQQAWSKGQLLPGDFVGGTEAAECLAEALQKRQPLSRGWEGPVYTQGECDMSRPLGLSSVKWEGWAGPACSLNSN